MNTNSWTVANKVEHRFHPIAEVGFAVAGLVAVLGIAKATRVNEILADRLTWPQQLGMVVKWPYEGGRNAGNWNVFYTINNPLGDWRNSEID
jgi:hypothetical protein